MDWPETLPNANQDLGGRVGSGSIVTQMDSGRKVVRPRFGNETERITLSWSFSATEMATFRTFFRDQIRGAGWFDLPVFDPLNPGVFTVKRVRFTENVFDYRYRPVNRWDVSAVVDVDIEQVETYVDPDLMPLLYQRVQEKTDNYTLQFTDLNSLITANPGSGETLIITLPLNAGFSDKFSCGVVNIGLGEVHFVAEPGVLLESFEGYYRVFGRFTPATITYIGINRFLAMGSLY